MLFLKLKQKEYDKNKKQKEEFMEILDCEYMGFSWKWNARNEFPKSTTLSVKSLLITFVCEKVCKTLIQKVDAQRVRW